MDDQRHAAPHFTGETMGKDAFCRIMTGLQEALSHAGGNDMPGLRLLVPRLIDVVAIRKRTGLSQAAFARSIGVAVSTLRNWEQGRRTPDGPARVLLALVDRNPRVVEETLSKLLEVCAPVGLSSSIDFALKKQNQSWL